MKQQMLSPLAAPEGMLALWYYAPLDGEDAIPVPDATGFTKGQLEEARDCAKAFRAGQVFGNLFNVVIVDDEGEVLDTIGSF